MSITLHAGDTYSLTTGKVTRFSPCTGSSACREVVGYHTCPNSRQLTSLAGNDLRCLQVEFKIRASRSH